MGGFQIDFKPRRNGPQDDPHGCEVWAVRYGEIGHPFTHDPWLNKTLVGELKSVGKPEADKWELRRAPDCEEGGPTDHMVIGSFCDRGKLPAYRPGGRAYKPDPEKRIKIIKP